MQSSLLSTWRPTWVALRKVGTNYDARFSCDGVNWSPRTPVDTNAFTVAYIGFGRSLCGTGAPAIHRVAIDRFNVI